MRNTGVYLVEAQLGQLKYTNLPPGEILFTLRIGRNYSSLSLASLEEDSPRFIGTLQLNVDSSALEAQRVNIELFQCSLSLNLNTPHDKRMIGLALVSLPKDKNAISSSYRLTQSQDKKAEIQLKIKITPLETSSLKNTGSIQINSDSGRVEEPAKPENNSNGSSYIKMKSKKSSEEETDRKAVKIYKEQDKVLEVNEKELRRYKQEKEAYYQMYQIEKSKNEVASKFISTVIRKLTEKYPQLLQGIQQQSSKQSLLVPNPEIKKKNSDLPKNRHPADVAAIAQLEQANRSLHRQVEEYKQIVEQLKNQVQLTAGKQGVQKTKSNGSSAFDQMFGIRQPSKDKPSSNNILPASLKDVNDPQEGKDAKQALAGVDLKKWLEISIGQRQEMMARFAQNTVPAEPNESQAAIIRKLRTSFNKAFAELLGNKEYTRPVLLSHKQQMNRILEECVSV